MSFALRANVHHYCPVCRSEIRVNSLFDDPLEQGRTYRCYACRLELVFDLPTKAMRVAPFEHPQPPVRGRRL